MTDLNLGYIRNHINNNYNIDTKYLITDCYINYEKKIISVYINCRLYMIEITLDEYNNYLRRDKLEKIKNKIKIIRNI